MFRENVIKKLKLPQKEGSKITGQAGSKLEYADGTTLTSEYGEVK